MVYTAIITHKESRLRERAKAVSKDEAVALAKKRMLRAYPNLRHSKVNVRVIRTTA